MLRIFVLVGLVYLFKDNIKKFFQGVGIDSDSLGKTIKDAGGKITTSSSENMSIAQNLYVALKGSNDRQKLKFNLEAIKTDGQFFDVNNYFQKIMGRSIVDQLRREVFIGKNFKQPINELYRSRGMSIVL